MKKIIYCFLMLLFTCNIYSSGKNMIWGDAGYLLNLNRISEGSEGELSGRDDGDSVNEIDRWIFNHLVYINFNYRYKNLLELGSDFSVILDDPAQNTMSNVVQQLYFTVSPAMWVSFKFGIQKLSWGTSRVFHPIDKLESYTEPLAIRDVVIGLAGIKILFMPVYWFSLSIAALPEFEMRYTRFAVRFDFTLPGEVDLGFGGIKYDVKHLSNVIDGEKKIQRLDRGAFFLDLVKYFGNFGLLAEFEFRFSRENEYALINYTGDYKLYTINNFELIPVFRVAAGLNYRMSRKPYMDITLEYFFNYEGFNHQEAQSFYTRYKYHKSNYQNKEMILSQDFDDFGSFRQHYLYLGFSNIQPVDFLALEFSVLSNLETAAFRFSYGIDFNIKKLIYVGFSYDFYIQFTDKNEFPSDLNFNSANHVISLSVTTSYKSGS